MNILIIEDDPWYAEVLKYILGKTYHLTVCSTLAHGRKAMQNSRWDAVLIDLSLPDSDREQTLDELKKERRGAALIIVTAYNEPSFRERMLLQNADGYVCKGEDDAPEELDYIIHRAVESRRTIGNIEATRIRLENRNHELHQ